MIDDSFPYKDDNPTRTFPLSTGVYQGTYRFFVYQFPLEEKEQAAYTNLDSSLHLSNNSLHLASRVWHGNGPRFSPRCLVMEESYLLRIFTFLYLFGDNVEDAIRKMRCFFFFYFCGVAATFAQLYVDHNPIWWSVHREPFRIAGYLLQSPRANIRVFYWFLILIGTFIF